MHYFQVMYFFMKKILQCAFKAIFLGYYIWPITAEMRGMSIEAQSEKYAYCWNAKFCWKTWLYSGFAPD